ncbi:MAG: hypothetical protein OEQ47_07545 [Acidimicrobiia bacterium]|nr:hypothetical protein [Acidimicrobiia bacterium]
MFDTERFPPVYQPTLTGDEKRQLEATILQLYEGDETGLSRALYYRADCDFDAFMSKKDTFRDRIFLLLKALSNIGQVVYLIQIILVERPAHPVLASLLDKWPNPPELDAPPVHSVGGAAAPPSLPQPPGSGSEPAAVGGGGDPWQVVLLPSRRPFLDRSDLRTSCRRVGLSDTTRILTVGGPSESGKSYTAQYLRGVESLSNGGPRPYVSKRIDLNRLHGVVATDETEDDRPLLEVDGLRLAQRLALALTDEALPSHAADSIGSEQAATWAADTAFSIVSRAKQDPPRWLILDGFDKTILSPHAQELVNSVLDEVDASGRSVRVALLGYTADVSWLSGVQPVTLDLADFSDGERLSEYVINFLLEVRTAAEAGERPPYTDEQLDADVLATLALIQPTAPDLHVLEAALTAVAERVLVGV